MNIDQDYEVVNIDGDHDPLKEHPQNPNRGDVAVIDESIDENGWYGAVIAQVGTGYILTGNHRYRAAKARGAKEIPVIWKDVDDEIAVKIMLGDNQIARRAQMDEETLNLLLDSLETTRGTGFDAILHPLEKELAGDEEPQPRTISDAPSSTLSDHRAGASGGGNGAASITTRPDWIDERGNVDVDAVPEDKHTPEWGIMISCFSEADQAERYEELQHRYVGRPLRLVAV